jgi:branched-chain amino acid transport system substrate-binding protein
MQFMIRRQIKKITGGRTMFLLRMAGLIALFGWISAAPAMAGDVLGIGVQNDQSGVYADGTGAGATAAAQLAAEDFGGHVAGMTIKVLSADNQNKADIGASIARNWIERGEVETIVDLGSSAAALAVNDIVRDANKVMLVSSASAPQLTGKSCTPNTMPPSLRTGITWWRTVAWSTRWQTRKYWPTRSGSNAISPCETHFGHKDGRCGVCHWAMS